MALDDALLTAKARDALARIRKDRVVELRYFGGLNMEETVQVLAVSANTVKRDWTRSESMRFTLPRRGPCRG